MGLLRHIFNILEVAINNMKTMTKKLKIEEYMYMCKEVLIILTFILETQTETFVDWKEAPI